MYFDPARSAEEFVTFLLVVAQLPIQNKINKSSSFPFHTGRMEGMNEYVEGIKRISFDAGG